MYPNVSKLVEEHNSKFAIVILAAKRARQINDYLSSIKRHELTDVRGPELDMINEKPLSIAFREIEQGRISYERLDEGTTEN